MNKIYKNMVIFGATVIGMFGLSNRMYANSGDAERHKQTITQQYVIDGDTMNLELKVRKHHSRCTLEVRSSDGSITTGKDTNGDGKLDEMVVQRYSGDKAVLVPGYWNYSGLNNANSASRQNWYSKNMQKILDYEVSKKS